MDIDVRALNNRIKRLTRKYKIKPKSNNSNTFRVSPGGYSYRNSGIRLVSRVERKRVFIPLKDATAYKRQLNIIIMNDYIKIAVPTEKKIVSNSDYDNIIYAHIGYQDMITLANGHVYGADLQKLVLPETERLTEKNNQRYKMYKVYSQNLDTGNIEKARNIEQNNLGKIKYNFQKSKHYAETVKFINTELNKMFETEKPCKVVITAPIKYRKADRMSKSVKVIFNRSFAGVIRKRLEQKCFEKDIELVQINSKNTGNICSGCGAEGIRKKLELKCEKCGMEISSAFNSAKNIKKKALNI